MRIVSILVLSFGLVFSGFSQQDTIINPNSTEKIPFYEQLYRFRIWRTIDLKEKQNAGFKSAQSDIANFLISSIQNGSLIAYDDSVKNVKAPSEILVSNQAVLSLLMIRKNLSSLTKRLITRVRIINQHETITLVIYPLITNGGN